MNYLKMLLIGCSLFLTMACGAGSESSGRNNEAEYRESCTVIPVAELTKNAQGFKGRRVKYSGQILVMNFPKKTDRGTTPYGMILSVNDEEKTLESGLLPLYISFEGKTDCFIYDQVTVYGEVYGDFEYQSPTIQTKKLPRGDVWFLDKVEKGGEDDEAGK